MKRQRKPVDPKPIIFYRPAWTVGIHARVQPHTTAHRLLFRQYLWRLPKSPDDRPKHPIEKLAERLSKTQKAKERFASGQVKSTDKSVSVDDAIARIDDALKEDSK